MDAMMKLQKWQWYNKYVPEEISWWKEELGILTMTEKENDIIFCK